MASKITLDGVRKRKLMLQKEIRSAIDAFKEDTGVQIQDIGIEFFKVSTILSEDESARYEVGEIIVDLSI